MREYRNPLFAYSVLLCLAISFVVLFSACHSPESVECSVYPTLGYPLAFERPARVPAHLPLTQAKPPFAIAGEVSTWRLAFDLATTIEPRQKLMLAVSGGRHNKGPFKPLQVTDPSKAGYVTSQLGDGTPLSLSPLKRGKIQAFDIHLPETTLPAGTKIFVTIGDTSGGGEGTTAPEVQMRNKFFALYGPDSNKVGETATPSTKLHFETTMEYTMVGACLMHILGGKCDHLRAYIPSQCRPGEVVDVLIRPEDRFSNLSHQTVGQPEIFLGSRKLPASFKPVERSTCIRARIRIPAEGVHRFRVVDGQSGKECVTNPTVCKPASQTYNLYWGVIHGHTELSDGWGSLDNYYRQMRDEAALDFGSVSDHDHLWETLDSDWVDTCKAAKRWHEPGRFVTFLGYEWAKWRRNGDGDRNVYYLEDDQPMYRSDDGYYPRPPDLFRALEGKKAIVIPHHPGGDGNFCDYKDHDPQHERFIEIHQVRGCYECSVEMGNPLIAKRDHPNRELYADGFVCNALAMGWRAGFTAGGDDHLGTAGTERPFRIDNGKTIYAGLMAVLATERTREAIWDALWNRRVIATSGPRMLLRVDLNGHPIGSELNASNEPALKQSRQIRVWFHGTEPVQRIDIIRNNKVVYTTSDSDFTWEDNTPLSEVLLPAAKYCKHPFCFYYVRAVQSDSQAAWASPIWIGP